eukprot:894084_1
MYCPLSSWYVQESGEVLVDCLLNTIHNNDDNVQSRQLCARALSILEGILSHCQTESYNPLSVLMNRIKVGKLLLYLNPDPCRAISELQSVRSKLLLYYPKDHEIMSMMEDMLMSAYQ